MKEPPRQKWLARALLLLGAVAGFLCLWHIDLNRRISTNVLELVPDDERSPELTLLRNLEGQEQARVLLLALRVPPRPKESPADLARRGDEAAVVFAKALAAFPAIAQAIPLSDPKPRETLAKTIYRERFNLLLPEWLEQRARQFQAEGAKGSWSSWLAERAATDLEAYLSRPEALSTQEILTSDPLLLVPSLVGKTSGLSESGMVAGRSGEYSLIWARSRESPLSEGGQDPVFAAVDGSLAAVRATEPAAELRWTGIARLAAASRLRIEKEMSTLNILSLACVILIVAACIRQFFRAFNLVPVVLGSLLGAWVATVTVWKHVHILVFVVGSLLAGVAVDYGFYLCLQPRSRPDEPYRERAARLLRPLLASALTTVIGFSFLLWSELPLIRQLGVFVSAGLICALTTALLWFAQVDNSFIETRAFIHRRPLGSDPKVRKGARIILVLGAVVALVGPWRLHWRDDIRELEIPTPELNANDDAVRALFGETAGRSVYLTLGATPGQARASLDAFLSWHAREFPKTHTATLGYALPTESEWAALPGRLASLSGFADDLRAALERHGFEPAAFDSFFDAWGAFRRAAKRPTYDELVGTLNAAIQGPLSSLLHIGEGMSWFSTIAEHPEGVEPPANTNTVSDSQLQNLNHLFSRYRISALRLSCVGLAFVGASVFVLYGLRRGVRIFSIPAGACLFAFGLFGLAGLTLNLFNLLGAFLGVCLSHNYAIFSAESQSRGDEPPPSIRMSAAAAASSFGVLSLSRIPVVAALGSTVAVIVLAALAITELAPLGALAPNKRPGGR